MSVEAAQTVLRRKTRAGQGTVGPTAMDTPKAIRVAFARAGDTALEVPLGVRKVEVDAVLPEDLSVTDPDNVLVMQVTDGEGTPGAVLMCPQSVAAVIEATTLGKVSSGEAQARAPTRTDARLVTGFLDAALSGFAELATEMAHPPSVEDYTVTARFDDLRTAQMALGDVAHKRFTVTVDFALGAKVGVVTIILPAQRVRAPQAGDLEHPSTWSASLEKAVMGTAAELEAILCTTKLPIEMLAALKPGDVLPLPGASLDSVTLRAVNGKRASNARLGRAGPMRAVRVRLNASDEQGLDADGFTADTGVGHGGAGMPAMGAAAPQDLGSPMDLGDSAGDFGGDMAAPLDLGGDAAAPLDAGFDQPADLGAFEPAAFDFPDDQVA
ncbi:MAG: FliM/FliN family flagellar motor switch protein [Pseudomonadota bacterium]